MSQVKLPKVYHTSARTSGKDTWRTPGACFEYFNYASQFDLDAAADETNHLCPVWYGPGGLWADALTVSWELVSGRETHVWLNPPYSQTQEFITKAVYEVLTHDVSVTALLASRTDTAVFHSLILAYASDIYFIKGRLKFLNPDGTLSKDPAPFPSLVAVFPAGGREGGTPTIHTLNAVLLNS